MAIYIIIGMKCIYFNLFLFLYRCINSGIYSKIANVNFVSKSPEFTHRTKPKTYFSLVIIPLFGVLYLKSDQKIIKRCSIFSQCAIATTCSSIKMEGKQWVLQAHA